MSGVTIGVLFCSACYLLFNSKHPYSTHSAIICILVGILQCFKVFREAITICAFENVVDQNKNKNIAARALCNIEKIAINISGNIDDSWQTFDLVNDAEELANWHPIILKEIASNPKKFFKNAIVTMSLVKKFEHLENNGGTKNGEI
jgi:hypothetical protein